MVTLPLLSQNTFQITTGGLRQMLVAACGDGGYLTVSAMQLSGPGQDDIVIRKTDTAGVPQWIRAYGSTYHERIGGVVEYQGAFYLCGRRETASDTTGILVKLNAGGSRAWAKTYPFSTMFTAVTGLSDGHIAVTGTGKLSVTADANMLTLKIDTSGNALWGFMPEASATRDTGRALVNYGGGGVWSVGTAYDAGGSHKGIYYANAAGGNAVFAKTYADAMFSDVLNNGGAFCMAGMNLNVDDYPLLVKAGGNGDTLSTISFGAFMYQRNVTNILPAQFGYFITGNSFYNTAYAMLIDDAGSKIWHKEIADPVATNEKIFNAVLSTGGRITMGGYTESGPAAMGWMISGTGFGNFACNTSDVSGGWWQVNEPHSLGNFMSTLGIASAADTIALPLLTCALMDDLVCVLSQTEETTVPAFRVFPVPAQDAVTLESDRGLRRLELFSVTGSRLLSREAAGARRMEIDLRDCSPGLYLLRIELENGERAWERLLVD